MVWLALQLGWLLLLAAGFGGLVGWALRALRGEEAAGGVQAPALSARVAQLEADLRDARETTAELRRKLDANATPGMTASSAEDERLTLRNRQLEARVRYLESKLEEARAEPAAAPEVEPDISRRLQWQNRYLLGRLRYIEEELRRALTSPDATAIRLQPEAVARQPEPLEPVRPPTLQAARGGRADNLKQISGIGPRMEQKLNEVGIWHFDQIAGWSPSEVAWMNVAVAARGRIEKDGWVAQAAQLLRAQRQEA